MFQVFRFRTTVHTDLRLSTYVDVRTVAETEFKGIVNEVLVLADEAKTKGVQPEVRVRLARRVADSGTVQVYEIGARALSVIPEDAWPQLREALASFGLGRLSMLLASAGINMPAVVLGEAQAISDRTAAMLLGLPYDPTEPGPAGNPEA